MDPRLYRFLKYTAIIMTVLWLSWGIYDSFFQGRDPGDTHYHAANKLFEDRAYERALEAYDNALLENQHHIHSMRGRARALMQLGRFDEALISFNRAIAQEPDFGGTYANRGILYDRLGKHQEALNDYRTALRIDPEIAEGPHWLTRFLRNQPERPPSIADRAAYLALELEKPESERVLQIPTIDQQQRSYKK